MSVKIHRCQPRVEEYQSLQWTGENLDDVAKFCDGRVHFRLYVEEEGKARIAAVMAGAGEQLAEPGDYVLRSTDGRMLFVVKKSVYEALYQELPDE